MSIEQLHAAGEAFFVCLALLIFLSALTSGLLIGYGLGWRDRGKRACVRKVHRKQRRRLPTARHNVMIYSLDDRSRDYGHQIR